MERCWRAARAGVTTPAVGAATVLPKGMRKRANDAVAPLHAIHTQLGYILAHVSKAYRIRHQDGGSSVYSLVGREIEYTHSASFKVPGTAFHAHGRPRLSKRSLSGTPASSAFLRRMRRPARDALAPGGRWPSSLTWVDRPWSRPETCDGQPRVWLPAVGCSSASFR